MATQELKDRNGIKIGEIRDRGSNKAIYDRNGILLGEYRPNDNKTYDRNGMLVGSGNQLTLLLR